MARHVQGIDRLFVREWVKPWNVIGMVGKRESGKSVIMTNLLYDLRHFFHSGIVISPTEDGNCTFGDFVPQLYIYTEYNPHVVENFINQQKKILKKNKKIFRKRRGRNPTKIEIESLKPPPSFIVLDDCAYDERAFNKDKTFKEIIMNGRHYNIFLIISLQYLILLDKKLRGNVDWIFFTMETSQTNLNRFYDEYFNRFPNKEVFKKAFREMTDGFKCIVANNNCKSNNFNESVFWYEAQYPVPDYTLGSNEYILQSMKFLNEHYDDSSIEDDSDQERYGQSRCDNDDDDDDNNDFMHDNNSNLLDYNILQSIKNPNEIDFILKNDDDKYNTYK